MHTADDFEEDSLENSDVTFSAGVLSTEKAEACWRRCQALRPKLATYLRAMLPDHHAVDDCLQDTFMLMAQRYADAGADDLAPLAFTCARNKAHTWLARHRVGRLSIIDPEVLGKIAEAAAQQEEEESVEYPARVSALRECLDRLTPEQRELIEARYGDDRDSNVMALAGTKGRNRDALYKQLERLRTILKRCVTGKLATPDE